MLKSQLFASVVMVCFVAFSAKGQSSADPGISTHNYKHPNKAAQATAASKKKNIAVTSLGPLEAHYKKQNLGNMISTPKYMVRPATLVIIRTFNNDGNDLNPLLSPRNYKTAIRVEVKRNWEIADLLNSSDTTSLPTVD